VLRREGWNEKKKRNGRATAEAWIAFRGTKRRGAEGSEEEDEQLIS